MPMSYLDITGSTASVHSYAALEPLDNPSINGVVDDHEDQLRLFKNGTELVRPGESGAEYSVDQAAEEITLGTALVVEDRLVILRQTRQDRLYVEFTRSAPLSRAVDLNLYFDQMIHIVQEIREYAEVAEIIDGITRPDVTNKEKYLVSITGSTSDTHSYAAIELIGNHSVRHEDQLLVRLNGVLLSLAKADYTVNAVAKTVVLASPLTAPDVLEIERSTLLSRIWPSMPEGSSYSSDVLANQVTQIRFLIEELPFVLGLDGSPVLAHRHARRKDFIKYSGPGDVFFYGNLPYIQYGTVYVWKDDALLTEGDDYVLDDWAWLLNLINDLLAGEVLTIQVVPDCSFPHPFCIPLYPGTGLGPPGDDGAATGPTQSIPAVLVPCTFDDTTTQDASATTLVLDGSDSNRSDILIHWDLSSFVGRTATAATFGLFNNTGMDATDDVEVWEADENFNKVGEAPVLTWNLNNTVVESWRITPSILTFVNSRLADDGHVRVLIEGVSAVDLFTAWSREGQATGNVFGPHLSLNGAAYPTLSAELAPSGDTMMSQALPTTLFHSDNPLSIAPLAASDAIPYFEFDVSAINLASFSEIKLQITPATAAGFPIFGKNFELRRCIRTDTVLTEVTWNQYKSGSNWTSGGAAGSGTDYTPTNAVDWVIAAGGWELDVPEESPSIKAMVADAQAGDGILRLIWVQDAPPNIGDNFYSLEESVEAKRPRLLLIG